MTIRAKALELLTRWERGGVFAESLIDEESRNGHLEHQDRSLLNALVYGVLRHKTWLDFIIDSFCTKGHLEKNVRFVLRLGLCQVLIMDVPDHAAVNETVKLAPKKAVGFVNALMRRTVREKEQLLSQRETLPFHVRFSTPEWLVNHWIDCFGKDSAEKLLVRQQMIPSLYARRNPLVPLPTPIAEMELKALASLPGWYEVKGALPKEALKVGALYMADPATRHAVEMVSPHRGEKIMDACAAPGGKSVAMLQQAEGKLHLVATDMAEHRLPRLKENLEKWASESVETAQYDWCEPCPSKWIHQFDAVLLDVPCSNSGVTQRRVDVRWRLSMKEIKRLTGVQLQILEHAAQAVKQTGRLVYSTCSIDPLEDGGLVRQFVSLHPEWKIESERLILPYESETDGAYAARLIRA